MCCQSTKDDNKTKKKEERKHATLNANKEGNNICIDINIAAREREQRSVRLPPHSLCLWLGLSPALSLVAMSTALIYWQSMNGSGASNGLESSPATHLNLTSHLAAPAAADWHYNTPAAASAMPQRPPYARNWSAESNSSNSGNSGNSGQHYLAQIGCQHSVKNLVNGFVNSTSKFKATAKHNEPMDKHYNCKLYKGLWKGGRGKRGGQLIPKALDIIDLKRLTLSL